MEGVMCMDRNKIMHDLIKMNEQYKTKEERSKTYPVFRKKLDMYCNDLLKELERDMAERNKRLEKYFKTKAEK
jgi:two-component SAPR family response regulator